MDIIEKVARVLDDKFSNHFKKPSVFEAGNEDEIDKLKDIAKSVIEAIDDNKIILES